MNERIRLAKKRTFLIKMQKYQPIPKWQFLVTFFNNCNDPAILSLWLKYTICSHNSQVIQKKDLTFYEMEEAIQEFAKDSRHASADMCVVAIMSHGQEKAIISKDNKELEINWILEQFNNRNCENLRGKPKFFIFQSCR